MTNLLGVCKKIRGCESKASARLHGFVFIILALSITGCVRTAPSHLPVSKNFKDWVETFLLGAEDTEKFQPKNDILFVVDNSKGMEPVHEQLKEHFKRFMKETLELKGDVCVGVIPTDAYLAHPAYLARMADKGPSLARKNRIREAVTFYESERICTENYTTEKLEEISAKFNQIIKQIASTPGSGSERPLQSIIEFVRANELGIDQYGNPKSAQSSSNHFAKYRSRFFRPGSFRSFVILTDEDDQSTPIDHPFSFKGVPLDGGREYSDYLTNTVMKSPAGHVLKKNWEYANASCPEMVADSYRYRLFQCPSAKRQVLSIVTAKNFLDEYFKKLDEDLAHEASYSITSFVLDSSLSLMQLRKTGKYSFNGRSPAFSVESLQAKEDRDFSFQRADRLIAFSELVGNSSLVSEITAGDYAAAMSKQVKMQPEVKVIAHFKLKRSPAAFEQVQVAWMKGESKKAKKVLNSNEFTLAGDEVRIINQSVTDQLKVGDRVEISFIRGVVE